MDQNSRIPSLRRQMALIILLCWLLPVVIAASAVGWYVLSGTGRVLCDGVYEPLAAGSCHYCPKGHAHSLINDSQGALTFFAVVPNQ